MKIRIPLHQIRRASHHRGTLSTYTNPNFIRQLHVSPLPEITPPPYYVASSNIINPYPLFPRYISSSPSSSSSSTSYSSSPANIVHIESDKGYEVALKNAKDEKMPSIFYFTAAWCGPCRMIAPVIEHMSKELPHVMTYKLDIDQAGLADTLNKLQIFSVPTILFFHNGQKATEIVGADVAKLKETMERLYK